MRRDEWVREAALKILCARADVGPEDALSLAFRLHPAAERPCPSSAISLPTSSPTGRLLGEGLERRGAGRPGGGPNGRATRAFMKLRLMWEGEWPDPDQVAAFCVRRFRRLGGVGSVTFDELKLWLRSHGRTFATDCPWSGCVCGPPREGAKE